MRLFLALLLISVSSLATAQDFPNRYRVRDVPASSALNIRQSSDRGSEIIGKLPATTTGIEVLRLSNDGRWGRIGTPEGNGWVSMRYLEALESWPTGEIPRPLRCYGTEPSWTLAQTEERNVFSIVDQPEMPLSIEEELAVGTNFFSQSRSADSADQTRFTLIVTRGLCTDGSSGREFGFRASLFIESGGDPGFQSGCCSLDSR